MRPLQRLIRDGFQWLERFFNTYFQYPQDRFERWIHRGTLALLYLLGLGLWGYILDFGDFPLDFHDWAEGTGHRLAFLQQVVTNGQLPLHMPDGSALRNVTDRFVAIPDTILSPQVLLLRWVGLSQFVLINTLVLYTIGYFGLWLWKIEAKLSAFSFSVLFLLFNFNGHITDHLIVGHMHWVGYFLLPYFFLLLFRLFDHQSVSRWRWVLSVSVVLFVMFLQGAFHLFVLSLLTMGLIVLALPKRWFELLAAGLFSLLLSMFRILPPALEIGNFDAAFLDGFVSLNDLVNALISIQLPFREFVFSQSPLQSLGWWEYDHYIGLVGLIFLLFSAVQIARDKGGTEGRYRYVLVSFFLLLMLSIGRFYRPINQIGIPILSSQRVSTRLLIMPLVGLVFLGSQEIQKLFNRKEINWRWKVSSIGLLAILFHDLWQHMKLWRVRRMLELFDKRDVVFTGEFVANHPDPAYFLALVIGLAVTLSSLGYLGYKSSTEGATQH